MSILILPSILLPFVLFLTSKQRELNQILTSFDCFPEVQDCYGYKGFFDEDNRPPGREFSVVYSLDHLDSSESSFIFGGYTPYDETSLNYNDFWEYSITLNQLRWIHGPSEPNTPEKVVIDHHYDIENLPESRMKSGGFVSLNDTFVLIGGCHVSLNESRWNRAMNDVWEFDVGQGAFGEWRRIRKNNLQPPHSVNRGVYDPLNHPFSNADFQMLKIETENMKDDEFVSVTGMGDGDLFSTEVWKYSFVRNQWAFIRGRNDTPGVITNDFKGNYNPVPGHNCTTKNYPSDRAFHSVWVVEKSESSTLFMFGGGYYLSGRFLFKNDLWSYSFQQDVFCWIHGPKGVNSSQVIEKNIAYSPNNVPGYLSPSASFSGNYGDSKTTNLLFLFSGFGKQLYGGSSEIWVFAIDKMGWKRTFEGYIPQRYGAVIWKHSVPNSRDGTGIFIFGGSSLINQEFYTSYNGVWEYQKLEFACGEFDRDDKICCSGHGQCESQSVCHCSEQYSGLFCQDLHPKSDPNQWWIFVVFGSSVLAFIVVMIAIYCTCCWCCIMSSVVSQPNKNSRRGMIQRQRNNPSESFTINTNTPRQHRGNRTAAVTQHSPIITYPPIDPIDHVQKSPVVPVQEEVEVDVGKDPIVPDLDDAIPYYQSSAQQQYYDERGDN